jgi:flagellar protein FliS
MTTYQEHTLDGASPVDLVVALYDGMIRFLYGAIGAVERADVRARRVAVKRALAILIHLQARLRMDIGGRPAMVLSEYYASMFALILQASVGASAEKFEEVIGCLQTLRDVWKQVATETSVSSDISETLHSLSLPRDIPRVIQMSSSPTSSEDTAQTSRWTA